MPLFWLYASLISGPLAHAFFPDADDTSRAITTLNLHGYHISPSEMVQRFEEDEYFETFDKQVPNRVVSISVNGNVLNAILRSPDSHCFTTQVDKIARFLCTRWVPHEILQDHWVRKSR